MHKQETDKGADDIRSSNESIDKIAKIIRVYASILGGGIILCGYFLRWGHEATGLSKWVIAPFAIASVCSLGALCLKFFLPQKKA